MLPVSHESHCKSPVPLSTQAPSPNKRRSLDNPELRDAVVVTVSAKGSLDEYRFNMYMRDLLAEKAKDIFRCKGVLSVHVSVAAVPVLSVHGRVG